MNLESLIGKSWFDVLNDYERECFFEKYLEVEKKRAVQDILPIEAENSGIYHALKITPFEKVKVLIIGQDPYPNKEDAHGLAFSKLSGKIPASLRNIFEKINEETDGEVKNTSGNLTSWAEQGVLLLNRALTFSKDETLASRNKFWLPVIDTIINKLIERRKPLIIILWGNPANDIEQFSFEKEEGYKKDNIFILRSSHPSNMGNAKNSTLKDGKIGAFTSTPIFGKLNEMLNSIGEKEIDWRT